MLASRVSAHVPTSAPSIKCTAAGRGINPCRSQDDNDSHGARGGLNCDRKAGAKQHSEERVAADLLHRLDKGSVVLKGPSGGSVACGLLVDRYVFPMRLLAAIYLVFTPLLTIGCATQDNQPTAAETALEKYDQRGWNTEEGRVR